MRICRITQQEITLQEKIEEFINCKKAQHISDRTLKDYDSYLHDFLMHSHNSMNYETLKSDITNYLTSIPLTSPARFNHPYQNISSFFNWAVEQKIIEKNPIIAQGISKIRDEGNIKPANIEDIKKLLNSFDKKMYSGLRNYIIILVMLDTGIRTSELIRLKNSDFDYSAKQITITKHIAKTRRQRVVYLSQSTCTALNNFIKIKPKEWCDLLFPTREGNQLRTEGLDLEFNRQCKKIGVKFTPYQLRHTFATYFAVNGGNLFSLQDIMGHSDIRTTRRYADMDVEANRKQHDNFTPINEIVGKPRLTKIK